MLRVSVPLCVRFSPLPVRASGGGPPSLARALLEAARGNRGGGGAAASELTAVRGQLIYFLPFFCICPSFSLLFLSTAIPSPPLTFFCVEFFFLKKMQVLVEFAPAMQRFGTQIAGRLTEKIAARLVRYTAREVFGAKGTGGEGDVQRLPDGRAAAAF